MSELIKIISIGIAVLLPLANPLTTVALFLGLSGQMSTIERNREVMLASVWVFVIMMVTWYTGQIVMNTFGISIPGLRIAGGLIVSFIGFRMLFPPESHFSKNEENQSGSIAFVPLAMPGTAGPGTIAMIISLAATARQDVNIARWVLLTAPPIVFLAIGLILWASLRSSGLIMRIAGKGGIDAISRLMGFLLVCMGVQFVINGITELMCHPL